MFNCNLLDNKNALPGRILKLIEAYNSAAIEHLQLIAEELINCSYFIEIGTNNKIIGISENPGFNLLDNPNSIPNEIRLAIKSIKDSLTVDDRIQAARSFLAIEKCGYSLLLNGKDYVLKKMRDKHAEQSVNLYQIKNQIPLELSDLIQILAINIQLKTLSSSPSIVHENKLHDEIDNILKDMQSVFLETGYLVEFNDHIPTQVFDLRQIFEPTLGIIEINEIDLLKNNYLLPMPVKEILDFYQHEQDDLNNVSQRIADEVAQHGYIFDYEVNGEPIGIRPGFDIHPSKKHHLSL